MNDTWKDLAAGAVILGLFVLVNLMSDAPLARSFALLFGVLYHAHLLGRRLFPKLHWFPAAAWGVALFMAAQSIVQTAWFYAGRPLGNVSDTVSSAAAMASALALYLLIREKEEDVRRTAGETWDAKRIVVAALAGFVSLAASGFVLYGAMRGATSDAIRTPWPLLPPGTLTAVAVAWGAVAVSVWLVRSRPVTTAQAGLAILATTAIAPLIYRLGFGFDGFLHIAAEKIVLATGSLDPKPFTYIGQYVFTTWLSRIADLPIDLVDRWLVPVGAAILLPFAVTSDARGRPGLAAFFLFLLPLSPFVATTPQSFAYLLSLVAFFLSVRGKTTGIHPAAPLLLSAWAAAVHPLAGIPALLIVFALSVLGTHERSRAVVLRGLVAGFFVVLAALSVPLLFYLLSRSGGTPIVWNLPAAFRADAWTSTLASFVPWIGNRFVVWPAWSALVFHALPVLLLALAAGSAVIMPKRERQPVLLLALAAILLFITAGALKTAGDFAFLIDYERGNYADRLNIVALLCLVPAAIPAAERLLRRAKERQPLLATVLLVGFLSVAAAQSYVALPRHDALTVGRGWSVGRSDLEAVRSIERHAGSRPYTVLANQSVSAAAVSELGFKRYHGDVFFYPIPTGGPLYETFLRMTYGDPSPETVREAARQGGSDLVYVVLNDYWWNAEQVGETVASFAHDAWTIGDPDAGPGRSVRVYAFDASKPINRPETASGS